MTFETMAHEMWDGAALQCVLLLLGGVAAVWALLSSRVWPKSPRLASWLATRGVIAPLVALAITMVLLADTYQRALEIEGFLPSELPPVPPDQKSSALGGIFDVAPVLIGQVVAVMLPLVTWGWARVRRPGPEHRGLRAVAVAAAGALAVAFWAASRWAFEVPFDRSSNCGGGCPSDGAFVDYSFELLEQHRAAIVCAGVGFGVIAVWFAVAQARRGVGMGQREWGTLIGLLAVAGALKLWTADERHDTRAYIRWEGALQGGFGRDADELVGPALDHCHYNWPADDLIRVHADPERQSDEYLVSAVEDYADCGDPNGITAILAEPNVAIARVAIVLQTAEAHGERRAGVASLRSSVDSRATTGEFIRYRSCVVEFTLGPEGVPLDRFSTWGELAVAADAADGNLVIDPGKPNP